jgi:hypothetical protein
MSWLFSSLLCSCPCFSYFFPLLPIAPIGPGPLALSFLVFTLTCVGARGLYYTYVVVFQVDIILLFLLSNLRTFQLSFASLFFRFLLFYSFCDLPSRCPDVASGILLFHGVAAPFFGFTDKMPSQHPKATKTPTLLNPPLLKNTNAPRQRQLQIKYLYSSSTPFSGRHAAAHRDFHDIFYSPDIPCALENRLLIVRFSMSTHARPAFAAINFGTTFSVQFALRRPTI